MDLQAIMKRVDAVGNYKWELDYSDVITEGTVDIVAVPLEGHARYMVAGEVAEDDAEFIVHALQDVPQLVARIEELEKELKARDHQRDNE